MKGEWPTSWFYQYDHYDYWIGKTVNLISIKKLTKFRTRAKWLNSMCNKNLEKRLNSLE